MKKVLVFITLTIILLTIGASAMNIYAKTATKKMSKKVDTMEIMNQSEYQDNKQSEIKESKSLKNNTKNDAEIKEEKVSTNSSDKSREKIQDNIKEETKNNKNEEKVSTESNEKTKDDTQNNKKEVKVSTDSSEKVKEDMQNSQKDDSLSINSNVESSDKITNNVKETKDIIIINAIKSIAFKESVYYILKNMQYQLNPIIEPVESLNNNLVWKSSDVNIATVNEEGVVTTYRDGKATIEVTSKDNDSIKAACTIVVYSNIETIKINSEDLNLKTGEEKKLTVSYTPENCLNKDIVWTSSDNNIATVTNDGVVSTVGVGTVIITATSKYNPSIVSMIKIDVTSPVMSVPPTNPIEPIVKSTQNIVFNPTKNFVVLTDYSSVKATSKYKIEITDSNGNIMPNNDFNISSSNSAIANVVDGTIYGKSEGRAVITISPNIDPTQSKEIEVNVVTSLHVKAKLKKKKTLRNVLTNETVSFKKGTTGIYNGITKNHPKAGQNASVYKNGDTILIDGNYYYIDPKDVEVYRYSISNRYSNNVAEEFVNFNNFTSKTNYLFWSNQSTETEYMFKKVNNRWVLFKTFTIRSGDALGLLNNNGAGATGIHFGQNNQFGWLDYKTIFQSLPSIQKSVVVGQHNNPWHSTPKVSSDKNYTLPYTHGCTGFSSTDLKWIIKNHKKFFKTRIIDF